MTWIRESGLHDYNTKTVKNQDGDNIPFQVRLYVNQATNSSHSSYTKEKPPS